MSNTSKSGSKKPRRRYFRRGSASDPKTNGSKPATESESSEKPKRDTGSEGRQESLADSRSSRRKPRSERRRTRDNRSDSKGQRSGSGRLGQRSNSDARRRRQKRRRGDLEQEEQSVEQVLDNHPSIIEAISREYKPPEAVYTYTHIVRADQRDAYEFRSDHFSHTSLHLEDYTIDLSSILTETGEIALKSFFQDIPSEEDLDEVDLDRPPKKIVKRSNTRPDIDVIQDSIGDDSETDFEVLFAKDFQDTSEGDFEKSFEEGEEKSLEQIYDELEMFKEDMEI